MDVKFQGIKIAGIACAVPGNAMSIDTVGEHIFDADYINRIRNTVGTNTLHFTKENQSSGDLGIIAAKRLMQMMEWDAETVDGIIFISQTGDFVVPPTSCRIQAALGIPESAYVLDSNYGCAGYIHGLLLAFQAIATGVAKRIILINSECHHKYVDRADESTALIFGDGAAATGIEKSEGEGISSFRTIVDGSYVKDLYLKGYKELKIPEGHNPNFLYMNGESVTKYMLKNLPKFVQCLTEYHGCTVTDFDKVFFHQANAYMIKFIAKRMKLDINKIDINIDKFGNTSSPSIPLLICDTQKDFFCKEANKTIAMIGFGAGFAISGAIFEMGAVRIGDIIFV